MTNTSCSIQIASASSNVTTLTSFSIAVSLTKNVATVPVDFEYSLITKFIMLLISNTLLL